jgi:hypothetical protein
LVRVGLALEAGGAKDQGSHWGRPYEVTVGLTDEDIAIVEGTAAGGG